MTGGIRPRSYVNPIGTKLPAYVVRVTHIAGDYANPWHDVIDDRAGVIKYWGDAKHSERAKTTDDFPGNRCLKAIYDELLIGRRQTLPPILHFSRPSSGKLVFNGLCVLEAMELSWFEGKGRPIRNYRYGLSILDEEYVDVDWLPNRKAGGARTSLSHIRTYILPLLGERALSELTLSKLQAFITEVGKRVNRRKTTENVHITLSSTGVS